MKRRNRRRRGTALLEFAFVGPALIMIWISTMQVALGMWHYHTMQYAVKATGYYLAVHGTDCGGTSACTVEIENLASLIKYYTVGIPPGALNLTFNSISSGDHKTVLSSVSCVLTNTTTPANGCDHNTTQWLPSSNNAVGSEFEILAEFQWNPAIGTIDMGAKNSFTFGSFWLPAYTHQVTLY